MGWRVNTPAGSLVAWWGPQDGSHYTHCVFDTGRDGDGLYGVIVGAVDLSFTDTDPLTQQGGPHLVIKDVVI